MKGAWRSDWQEAADEAAALKARVTELEKALRDVRGELESYSHLRTEYQDWTDAFKTIDTALMASSST